MGKITLDWNEYVAAARETIAEGMVLLVNTSRSSGAFRSTTIRAAQAQEAW